jgi:DNA-binding transcriptional ArsR family regulator
LEYEEIEVWDGRAKELAQILMNDKAIAILRLLQEKALSISEISRELNMPISTVSYHVDKMLRVGLIEEAGRKYGKRLQEVRLYRASERPILLIPGKSIKRGKLKLAVERLRVISLAIATAVSAIVYETSKAFISKPNNSRINETVRSLQIRAPGQSSPSTSPAGGFLPIFLALVAFVLTLLTVWFLRKRF